LSARYGTKPVGFRALCVRFLAAQAHGLRPVGFGDCIRIFPRFKPTGRSPWALGIVSAFSCDSSPRAATRGLILLRLASSRCLTLRWRGRR
jgi:hypothetical protein